MKKIGVKISALLLSASILLVGCSGGGTDQVKKDDGKLNVYSSFYPMYDFAKKIGKDKVNVNNLIPAGTEPHDWEPTPKDLVNIGDSDVFIYSGAGMEGWIDKVSENVKNDKMEMVEASKGVNLLSSKEEHLDKEINNDKHEHGAYDPHVWLDPENAKIQMKNIKEAFSKADPKNKDFYEKNYEENAVKLDSLDQKFKDEIGKTKKKDIIVAHEAFGYLCKAYGINQIGIEGLSPDSEPDAARMAEITNFAKKNNVKYIFFEELVSSKVSDTLAKEIGAKTEVLNPLEGLTDQQIKDGGDYFSVMEKNLNSILKALN
ncbi:MAG: metal ABC transporter substrate-binding protein [Peptostreptococcus sp.]|uniref:metal ABC transporter substrate-binding protein n=1 Tax=Peptostreptococcus sp. TaxID=1262 RepID=UPI002FCB3AE0